MAEQAPAQLNYSNRDYANIKNELLAKIPLITSKWTDWNEADLGITILELFTGLADMMSFYLDRMASETMLPTARMRPSVDNLCKLIDYHLAPPQGASIDLEVTLGVAYPYNVVIPKGFSFSTQDTKNKVTYSVIEDTTIIAGDIVANVVCGEGVRNEVVYISDGSPNQQVLVSAEIQQPAGQEAWVEVLVNGVPWTEEKSTLFGLTQAYLIDISGITQTKVTFGDGTNGLIPPTSATVQVIYWTGKGIEGRVGANSVTVIDQPLIVFLNTVSMTVTNPESSIGGENRESIEHAKYYAPKALRRGNRLITLEDYDTYSNSYTYPGLGSIALAKAYWKSSDIYACELDLYVLSRDISGQYVTSSTALKDQLLADIEAQRALCQKVNILDGSLNAILIDLDVQILTNANAVTVSTTIISEIQNYVNDLQFGSTLYISKLVDLAMGVEGVTNVVVNSPSSDISVSDTTVITINDIIVGII